MFTIKDAPGRRESEAMRKVFEAVIKQTAAFATNTPLVAITINDSFSHYVDPDTDTMWIGFALGMRAADRLNGPAAVADERDAASPIDASQLAQEVADLLDLPVRDDKLTAFLPALTALMRDAARYRWLRTEATGAQWEDAAEAETPEWLDGALDAAIKASEGTTTAAPGGAKQ